MNLLLDTHVVLWALAEPERLSAEARSAIEDGRDAVFVSAASAWEIGIKRALGKLMAPDQLVEALAAAGFQPLPITVEHATTAGALPPHHHDPFDRMLVAQAMMEGLTVVTRDRSFEPYGVTILKA